MLDTLALADACIERCAVQKPVEFAQLLDLVTDLKPKIIVEIGVHMGGTLYAWERIAPTAVGIDWAPDGPHKVQLGDSMVILGNSHNISTRVELMKLIAPHQIDFLFIDGDHSYSGVRSDYNMYAPLVKKGGLIAFHDIAPILPGQSNVDGIEVKRFWDEIKDEHSIEIIDTGDHLRSHIGGFGIGVLKVGVDHG